jgi:hypothetical protein
MTVVAAIPPITPATIDGADLCCGSEIEDVDELLVDTTLLDVVLGTPSRLEVVVVTTPDSTEVNVSVIGMVKLNRIRKSNMHEWYIDILVGSGLSVGIYSCRLDPASTGNVYQFQLLARL